MQTAEKVSIVIILVLLIAVYTLSYVATTSVVHSDSKLTQTVNVSSDILDEEQINTPYVLIEFIDFTCPYCKQSQSFVERLPEVYQLTVVQRHFPLSRESFEAALAYECAVDYGVASEMKKELFAQETLVDIQQVLAKFEHDIGTCMLRDDIEQRVLDDMALAEELGLFGTPTFLLLDVNNYEHNELILGPPLPQLIDEALSRWNS